MTKTNNQDKKSFYLLSGSLLTGIVIASLYWISQRTGQPDDGITDEWATTRGYLSAQQYRDEQKLNDRLMLDCFKHHLPTQDINDFHSAMQLNSPSTKTDLLITISMCGSNPATETQAYDALDPYVRSNDESLRSDVAIDIQRFRPDTAKLLAAQLSNDPDSEVRETAQRCLTQVEEAYAKLAQK